MLRKAISISLIVAMFAALLQFTFPYVWYYSNHDYIVTRLCENRHDPDVECDGYCVLTKKIKTGHNQHQDEHSKEAPERTNQSLKINLFFNNSSSFPLKAPREHTSQPWLNKAGAFSLWYGEIITPPPQNI